jgi:nickel-type superoxide dismutase maturation protease
MRLARKTLGAVVLVAVAARILAAGRWPVRRYAVDGPSMEPAYRAGDRVLVNRLAYVGRVPAVGDVVVLRDPEREGHLLLKRVATPQGQVAGPVPGESLVYVLGDNAGASRDSRSFGPIPRRLIVGKAWLRY